MTNHLFIHEGGEWEVNDFVVQYEKCKLILPIGPYPNDYSFASIEIDYNTGKMRLFRELHEAHQDIATYECNLILTVALPVIKSEEESNKKEEVKQ